MNRVVIGQKITEFQAGVLYALVAVKDLSSIRPAALNRLLESVHHKIALKKVAHHPADDRSGVKIKHHHPIEPTFAGVDVSDVRRPDPIPFRSEERLIQQVRSYRKLVSRSRRYFELALRPGGDPVYFHQSCDSIPATGKPLGFQFHRDARTAIDLTAVLVNKLDLPDQNLIFFFPTTDRPFSTGVVPAPR